MQFASRSDYENETATKAISPAIMKPKLDEISAVIKALRESGTVYNARRLGGKTSGEILASVSTDAKTLQGKTVSQIQAGAVKGSKSANGFIEFANGLIVQWGASGVKYTGTTVTLPKAFTTAHLWDIASPTCFTYRYGSGEKAITGTAYISIKSATLSTIVLKTSAYNASISVNWLAIGY